MNAAREIYNTLRWRLIPVRYAGKARRQFTARPVPARFAQGAANDVAPRPESIVLQRDGHAPGPTIDAASLAQMQAIYRPRAERVVPTSGTHPFTNLFTADDFDPNNPVFRFALSPQVLDAAHDYLGGKFQFDSIQVLYSWPTGGRLLESQLWHKDYGDATSFHCVAYLNDVLTPADGPFVYVDRNDTKKIAPSLLIRRIDDETFANELGDGTIRTFTGKAGESVLVDPSVCYHYGSRCQTPRLALFATFSTDKPFVGPYPQITENATRGAAAARVVRPDLSPAYLNRIFGA